MGKLQKGESGMKIIKLIWAIIVLICFIALPVTFTRMVKMISISEIRAFVVCLFWLLWSSTFFKVLAGIGERKAEK